MHVPVLYRVTRTLVHFALGTYFSKLEVGGREHVPKNGPVILASNHPHSIIDALILALAAGRMVHYIAHSGLFSNPIKSWFLRSTGVIPVYRPDEIGQASEKNVHMFSACHDLLDQGGAIGIFPEGTSAQERRVQKLKTGTARIALEGEARREWRLGTVIVPVGLNFESRQRFRSRVLVSFGKPIEVQGFRGVFEEDEHDAVDRLTGVLQAAIRRRVVNITHSEFEDLVRELELVYKSDVLERGAVGIPGDTRFEREQWVSREIPRVLDYFFERSPDVIWRIARQLKLYRRGLERVRLKDEMLRKEGKGSVSRATARFLILGAIGLPFVAYGIFWNGLPYTLTGFLARPLTKDQTKAHFVQLSVGAVLYVLYYTPLLYWAFGAVGAGKTVLFALSLPPTGLFARGYTRRMTRRRQAIRLAYLEWRHGYEVQRLRDQRQRIIDEVDDAVTFYRIERNSEEAARDEMDS